jgi:hypothetical protein
MACVAWAGALARLLHALLASWPATVASRLPRSADAPPAAWERLCESLPGASWRLDAAPQPHETHTLRLESAKAAARLGWRPVWALPASLDATVAWHRAWRQGAAMGDDRAAGPTAVVERPG